MQHLDAYFQALFWFRSLQLESHIALLFAILGEGCILNARARDQNRHLCFHRESFLVCYLFPVLNFIERKVSNWFARDLFIAHYAYGLGAVKTAY